MALACLCAALLLPAASADAFNAVQLENEQPGTTAWQLPGATPTRSRPRPRPCRATARSSAWRRAMCSPSTSAPRPRPSTGSRSIAWVGTAAPAGGASPACRPAPAARPGWRSRCPAPIRIRVCSTPAGRSPIRCRSPRRGRAATTWPSWWPRVDRRPGRPRGAIHRARPRRRPLSHACPSLGQHVGGLQRLRRKEPVSGQQHGTDRTGVPDGGRRHGVVQPALCRRLEYDPVDLGARARPLPRTTRLRRQLSDRRRHRSEPRLAAGPPPRRGQRARRVLVHEDAQRLGGRAGRGRQRGVHRRQHRLLAGPLRQLGPHLDRVPPGRAGPRAGSGAQDSPVQRPQTAPARVLVARASAIPVVWSSPATRTGPSRSPPRPWPTPGSGGPASPPGATIADSVGYEWDTFKPGCAPASAHVLLHWAGSPQNADAVTYTAASGARVFSDGTMQLTWALDDIGHTPHADGRVQALFANIFSDLGGAPPAHHTPGAGATRARAGAMGRLTGDVHVEPTADRHRDLHPRGRRQDRGFGGGLGLLSRPNAR